MGAFKLKYAVFVLLALSAVSCGGGGGGGGSSAGKPSPSTVYMWVSYTATNGNMLGAGASGANNICRTDASTYAATFATSVTSHRAALYISGSHPRSYFANNPPVRTPDGTRIVANRYLDYWDVYITLPNTGGAGGLPNIDGNAAERYHWLGLDAINSNCNGWTSDNLSDDGSLGKSLTHTGDRLNSLDIECSAAANLLCISW